MKTFEVTIPSLPADYRILDYDGDLLLTGKNLDLTRFNKIKAGLPCEIQQRLIGWRLVSRVAPGSASICTALQPEID